MSDNTPLLSIRNVSKAFGRTKALSGINFELRAGEIHAIAGENGAGKSTLMKVIDGIHQPDSGAIFVGGKETVIRNPAHAQKLGVGFVHQEIALCPDVSVAENILMSRINLSSKWFVNYKQLYQEATESLKRLADIDTKQKVAELSISNQQLVEIAKALTIDCKILILDEPTAAISESDAQVLFGIMQQLKSEGIGIIYISHRMAEIFTQCDRVSVFRDGHSVATYNVSETTPDNIVQNMVGREITNLYPAKHLNDVTNNHCMLSVHDLSDSQRFSHISFKVYQGEIFGIAGLIGAGRSELAKAIVGLSAKQGGAIEFNGQPVDIRNYQQSIALGVVYLSEDRKENGVFLDLSIAKNVSALNPEQVSKNGLINKKAELEQTETLTSQLNLKAGSLEDNVYSLSGGNQQKVALAKILSINPTLIILDEPTRGIDVGAKTEIHKLIRELANRGIGVIVISSELPEVIGLSDRVMVMKQGQNMGILTGDQINEEEIMHLASGSQDIELQVAG
ncbi:sugar ABC transporter ATP-binding protein [Vibrio sp.]|uniref:sugar ABC transporter ATP-binding protein n=1 Tax=Vibrio sp. TaxID=678 RepID=UPI003D139135